MTPDACPICHYSLEGLPAEYACPECGFAYDAETSVHVWRTDRFRSTFGAAVCALGAAVLLIAQLGSGVYGRTADLVLAAILSVNAWHLWRCRTRPGVRLIISSDLCRRDRKDDTSEWRWTDIADVQRTPGWINHLVTIIDRDGKKHTFMRTADRAKADAMVTRMRARLQKPSP